MSAKLHASALYTILSDALAFAGRDETLPMLNGVKLESNAKRLLAVATDRFALGASSAPWFEESGQEFSVFLPLDQVQLLMAVLRPPGRRRPPTGLADVRVTPKGTRFYVSFEDVSILVRTNPKIEFPKWRALLPKSTSMPSRVSATWRMNPTLLLRLAKVRGHDGAQFYSTGPTRPLCVKIGDHFVGLVMPMRLPGDGDANMMPWKLPSWL